MESKTEPLKIVNLLAYQEYKLSILYNEFAHKFPESKKLWEKITDDEREHQQMIGSLDQCVQEGKLYFNAIILKTSNIQKHIKSIEKYIERVKNEENFSIKDAFDIAVNLEHSMLDQNFFSYFSGDSEILNKALNFLKRDTQEHYNMLIEESNKIGSSK